MASRGLARAGRPRLRARRRAARRRDRSRATSTRAAPRRPRRRRRSRPRHRRRRFRLHRARPRIAPGREVGAGRGWGATRIRQHLVEVDVDRPGQVHALVFEPAGAPVEIEPNIGEHRGAAGGREPGAVDERRGHRRPPVRPPRPREVTRATLRGRPPAPRGRSRGRAGRARRARSRRRARAGRRGPP